MTPEMYMVKINQILGMIGAKVWGPTTVALIVGTGLYLSIRLKFVQFFKFSLIYKFFRREFQFRKKVALQGTKDVDGEISTLGVLMTSLGGVLGTGNIVGVSTAISYGGPGALFWMWVSAFLGMSTKYVECFLGVRYRVQDETGSISGGPMHYIDRGFKEIYGRNFKVVGLVFAAITVGTTFIDMVDANAIAGTLEDSFGIPPQVSAVAIFLSTTVIVLGGIQNISSVSMVLVPLMAFTYIFSCLFLLITNFDLLLHAVYMIFKGAFTPIAAAGGFLGSSMRMSVRYGMSRGVFSNEAGLGSGAFIAAAAKTDEPSEQGFVGIVTTFVDTMIVCTLTGLVIIVAGTWTDGRANCNVMVQRAFDIMVFPGFGIVASFVLTLFAFTSIISWAYLGERSISYLIGPHAINPYRLLYCMAAYVGAIVNLEIVWNIADVLNGLMMAPNLIALIFLSGVVVRGTEDYIAKINLSNLKKKVKSTVATVDDDDDDDDEDDDDDDD